MSISSAGKSLREGSAPKREAILSAARRLFLSEGFDRTSVDAIAAEATVSKRTVYDYFGDKRTLLMAVVEQAVHALSTAITTAIDEHLNDVDDVEASLIGFARAVTASAIGSSDYNALIRLLTTEGSIVSELRQKQWDVREPEDAVAERFADLDRRGLLTAPDPRLAADHFVALTLAPVATVNAGLGSPRELDRDRIITEGVRAFLRAYGR